jgi:RNA polymerase sigma-70 factor (ECF subfamily)
VSQDPEPDARFAAVLAEYGRLLRLTIVRMCPRDMGLQFDDVEQEARLRLWKALQGERPIDNLASYIYRVAASATIDAMRRVKARREQPLDADGTEGETENADERPLPAEATRGAARDPERAADHRLLLERVGKVVDGLEDKRRQVLRLHLQGFTTTEMAALLGTTEPSARNLLHRATKELRERLAAEGITYAGD